MFFLSIGAIPEPYKEYGYSRANLKYLARMAPFVCVTDPPLPTYDQLMTLLSVQSTKAPVSDKVSKVVQALPTKQAPGILELATNAVDEAKRLWQKVTKLSPEAVHSRHCEEMWKREVMAVYSAAIQASLSMQDAMAVYGNYAESGVRRIRLKIPRPEQCRHPCWIVPTIQSEEGV